MIYPNDHRPAHVHVIGSGCESVWHLHCPKGLPKLRENYGFKSGRLNQIERYFIEHLADVCAQSESDHSDIKAANRRGETKARQGIWATAARYDHRVKRVMVTLGRGVELALGPSEIEGLQYATSDELSEVSPKGLGLHFPCLDADVYLLALLSDVTGSKAWSAAMGQAGGQSRSQAKAEASRKNGRLGGRPKRQKVEA